MSQQAQQKPERKEVVSFTRRNGQVQQTRLSSSFSLAKSNMYNEKVVKGFDTFPQRMADIENDINGVNPSLFKMRDVAHVNITSSPEQLLQNAEPGFLKNLSRWFE